jgi:hypothetical protein
LPIHGSQTDLLEMAASGDKQTKSIFGKLAFANERIASGDRVMSVQNKPPLPGTELALLFHGYGLRLDRGYDESST